MNVAFRPNPFLRNENVTGVITILGIRRGNEKPENWPVCEHFFLANFALGIS